MSHKIDRITGQLNHHGGSASVNDRLLMNANTALAAKICKKQLYLR